jgi:hypothetical protein
MVRRRPAPIWGAAIALAASACGALFGMPTELGFEDPTGGSAQVDANPPSQDSGADAGIDYCKAFCGEMQLRCTGQYPNQDSCHNTCTSWASGNPEAGAGNNFWCRQGYVNQALKPGADVATDCGNAGPDGGFKCID